ncbi:hypothetical protein C8Q79DRAFT_315017 [Trametes meyenii]|nr:hypothetical protein C8Q79DRAFT_315017 [Trametes meyenii]
MRLDLGRVELHTNHEGRRRNADLQSASSAPVRSRGTHRLSRPGRRVWGYLNPSFILSAPTRPMVRRHTDTHQSPQLMFRSGLSDRHDLPTYVSPFCGIQHTNSTYSAQVIVVGANAPVRAGLPTTHSTATHAYVGRSPHPHGFQGSRTLAIQPDSPGNAQGERPRPRARSALCPSSEIRWQRIARARARCRQLYPWHPVPTVVPGARSPAVPARPRFLLPPARAGRANGRPVRGGAGRAKHTHTLSLSLLLSWSPGV